MTELVLGGEPQLRNPRVEMEFRPGSVRRSVRLDVSWPDCTSGDPTGSMEVAAVSTDVVVEDTGHVRPIATARINVGLQPGARVSSLVSEPAVIGGEVLIGRRASSGWRPLVASLVPAGGPLLQLLDDLPVAVLVSGYAGLRTGALDAMTGDAKHATGDRMVDICAGWSSDSIAYISLRSNDGSALIPEMAPAPVWLQADGETASLAKGSIRRERRIEVWRDGAGLEVEATFRDTYGDAREGEGVLHEYVVRARVEEGRLTSLVPEPRVLPFPECPSAVRATRELLGARIDALALLVPEVLSGVSSCTHLNDLLRSLTCVEALATELS